MFARITFTPTQSTQHNSVENCVNVFCCTFTTFSIQCSSVSGITFSMHAICLNHPTNECLCSITFLVDFSRRFFGASLCNFLFFFSVIYIKGDERKELYFAIYFESVFCCYSDEAAWVAHMTTYFNFGGNIVG